MKRILVIEDDPGILENITDLLTIEGFEVFQAMDGLQGVEEARRLSPDLILCDVTMPAMDGYEVHTALQRDEQTAFIPFIFLTAHTDYLNFREAMNLGADDFLHKPFVAEELLTAIRTRLEKTAKVTREVQRQIDHLRSQITLTLPHELRTPLTTILGYVNMMLESPDEITTDQMVRYLRSIDRGARRLARLVENYLLFAQLELLDAEHHRQSVALLQTEASAYIKRLARERAEEAGRLADLELLVEPATVQIDDGSLQKILDELVDNAFKFSMAGTPYGCRPSLWMAGCGSRSWMWAGA
ncbi:MAG: response regulator [Anaerolineae bacterium]|nr:response regulator [Anaerolineae bacterium]